GLTGSLREKLCPRFSKISSADKALRSSSAAFGSRLRSFARASADRDASPRASKIPNETAVCRMRASAWLPARAINWEKFILVLDYVSGARFLSSFEPGSPRKRPTWKSSNEFGPRLADALKFFDDPVGPAL